MKYMAAIFLCVCVVPVSLHAEGVAKRYRYGDTTVSTMLNLKWGTKAGKKLTAAQVDQFLVKHTGLQVDVEGKRYRNGLKRVHAAKKRSLDLDNDFNVQKSQKEECMLNSPYMTYQEEGGTILGFIPCKNVWIFDVVWQDDDTLRSVTVENKSGQTIFIDVSADPHNLIRARRLHGVRDGNIRRVSRPRRGTKLAIWKEQYGDEKLRDLVTTVHLMPQAQKVTVYANNKGLRAEVAV